MGTGHESVPGWIPGGGVDPMEPAGSSGPGMEPQPSPMDADPGVPTDVGQDAPAEPSRTPDAPVEPGQGSPAQPSMPDDLLAGSESSPPGTPPVIWVPPPPPPPASAIPGWGTAGLPDTPPGGWTPPAPTSPAPAPPVGWSPPATPTGGIPGWGTTGPAGGQGSAQRSNGCLIAVIAMVVVLSLVAIVAIVGLIFVGGQISAILSTAGTELSSPPPDAGSPSGGTVNVLDLTAGSCFDRPEPSADNTITQVTLLPCSGRHALEVVAVVTPPYASDAPYPGDSQIEQEAATRCTAAFTSYVGIPENASIYTVDWYRVTEPGWVSGDRMIDCLAMSDDGTPIVGSVRDVRR